MAGLNWKRSFYVADNHGIFGDRRAMDACLEHKRMWKPDFTAHLGDFHDATCLRSKASLKDKTTDYSTDCAMAMEFVEALRPDIILMGNHDYRLWRRLQDPDAMMRDHALKVTQEFEKLFDNIHATFLPYDSATGIYDHYGLKILHGYHYGQNGMLKHAQVYGDCIIGHMHRFEERSAVTYDRSTCIGIGYLAHGSQMDYTRTRTSKLRWQKGWAYGVYNERTGRHEIWPAKEMPDGKFLVSEGASLI